MTQEEMEIKGYYLVKAIIGHKYKGDWRFPVQWEGFSLAEATWELPKSFVVEKGVVNPLWGEYCEKVGLQGIVEATKIRSLK